MDDLLSFLTIFYDATCLPFSLYQNDAVTAQYQSAFFPDLSAEFREKLKSSEKKDIDYVITNTNQYLGIVKSNASDQYILLGPVSPIHPTTKELSKIMQEFVIPATQKEELIQYYECTPTFSLPQFVNLMAILNSYINHTLIVPKQYFYNPLEDHTLPSDPNIVPVLYDTKETEEFHSTYHYEQLMFHYVEEGNISAMLDLLNRNYQLNAGTIGLTSFRHHKNQVIITASLIARHSIIGGLDIETAYQLNDFYILEAEKASSIEAIYSLMVHMIMDFTKRVAATKMPDGLSEDVKKAMEYISNNTNKKIAVKDVADAIQKSPSLISKKFKKELGFNLCDYILRRKLEEGKSLLMYSDKSISEISEYLCFSSQSYFQSTFKKQFGMTPRCYKQKSKR